VLISGNRWFLVDMGDAVVSPVREVGKGGFAVLNREQATASRLQDRQLMGLPVYCVELWLFDADARVGFPVHGTGQVQFELAKLSVLENEMFDFQATDTVYVQQYTTTGNVNTPLLQSSQTGRAAGLLLSGKVRDLGGVLEVSGKVTTSRNISSGESAEKSVTLHVLADLDSWINVASVSSADANASLKPFGVEVGGGHYQLRLRVSIVRGPGGFVVKPR